MFYVEFTTEDGTKKAINIAMCSEIEVYKHQTSSRGDFCLKIFHTKGQSDIPFKTEEELDNAFKSITKAIQESETQYWKVPDVDIV